MIEFILSINKYDNKTASLNLLKVIDLIKKSYVKKDKYEKSHFFTNYFFNKKKDLVEKELIDFNPKYDNMIEFSPIIGQNECICQKCIICTINPSTVLFTKCAHLILCNECYDKYNIENFPTKCILCKTKSKTITVKYHNIIIL